MEATKPQTIVVLVGALDTKGNEIGFIRDLLTGKGHRTTIIDDGILGEPQIRADIEREEVAEAGGQSLAELAKIAREGSDRAHVIEVMAEGVAKIVSDLHSREELDAIFSLGGSTGLALAIKAMKALPVHVPKLMLVTHLYPQIMGEMPMTIMVSPADIMGLNPITKRTLGCAAGAISGMVQTEPITKESQPLIGITAAGITTPGVMRLQSYLGAREYDTVVFHVNSETMDSFVQAGIIDGIIDFTPYELIHIFLTRDTPDRKSRLEAAGALGIPQVFVPGGLDMIVLRVPCDRIPRKYKDRKIYLHGPFVTAVRTNTRELKRLAHIISDKVNRATGRVAVVFPLKGFSEIDKEGKPFYEPEINMVFISELKRKLKENILVRELDYHVNDGRFVEEVGAIYNQIATERMTDG